MKKIVAALFVMAVLSSSIASFAKTPEEKIVEIERTLNSLQSTYLKNNEDIASAIAGSRSMQDEWSVIKGTVDANRQLITLQHQDLVKMITELDHRIQAIEDRMQIFSSQLSKALSKVSPDAAAEGDLYQQGLDLVNQAKYLEAAAAFEKFLGKYKKSEFAPNATMWVAECFYSMRDYKRAIKEYQDFIEKYPHDKAVATAILNQGNSFYELGMSEEAKAFYQKVMQTYPSSTAASLARERMARITEKEKQPEQPASPFGTYPAETLEQKRQKMSGQPEAAPEPPKENKPAPAPAGPGRGGF